MKIRKTSLLLLAVLTSAMTLYAQSSYEREFTTLEEQHTKAIAVAVEPIIRRYQTSLEQLLQRATQNKDLKTASKIVEKLTALKNQLTTTEPATIGNFRESIVNTSWTWVHPEQRITFLKDGAAKVTGGEGYTWSITNPARRIIEGKFENGRTFKMTFAPNLKSGKGVLDGNREWETKLVTGQ